jgi:hypothetical protein
MAWGLAAKARRDSGFSAARKKYLRLVLTLYRRERPDEGVLDAGDLGLPLLHSALVRGTGFINAQSCSSAMLVQVFLGLWP